MEESFVYLQKPTGLSHPLLASKNPTRRRRCEVDSSELWINMGKTNPVEEHKCNESENDARKTESAQQENAVVGDCEIDVQEQGEWWRTTARKAKRTRCVYSPSIVVGSSLRPSSAALQTSSKPTECDSSASNSEDPGSDQVSEPSSTNINLLGILCSCLNFSSEFSSVLLVLAGVAGGKILKLKEEVKSHKDLQTSNVKDQHIDVISTKTGEYLDLEVNKLHQTSLASDCAKATSSLLDPLYTDNQHVMEIVLVDVQMTVDASPQAENVPFVSLSSGAYGIAIIGYPLDVGEVRDDSEALPLSKESIPCKLFGDQLVWKRSRRSPVCYVTTPLSASIAKNAEGSILPDGENGLLRKEKYVSKLLKNRNQMNQRKTAPNKTCVPVELIFSKILAAVGQVQS